jgi:hypothetical protein
MPGLVKLENTFVSLQTAENVTGRKEEVVTGEWKTRHNHCALHYILKVSVSENCV